ncbi:hypothetical protein Dsin_010021 [Dipteronia sinensis]|uniref:Uncharacterized protein n=1 Tax=Dipteronia sinensis TaxID=43782 RepID=A0AAE0ECA5_9ROSI|nr:hypothetical protein Dsin_010021 [Dipteronia sinensis]
MHDLINDLAQWAAKGFCVRVENALEGEKIPKNLRHLSYVNGGSNNECINKFEAFNEIKSIRTFLQITPVPWPHYSASDFLNMLPQLRRLRVLSLHGYPISELPNTIGELKHLRYLNLSDTKIEKLPNSINTLYNLETLILKDCSCLKNLCSDIGNLINMRHLYISYACPLEGMPLRIGRLTCLRTLPVYVVGKDDGFMLKELRNLTHLRDKLHISRLENVNDVEDAKEADFIGKKNLRELELIWTSSFSLLRNVEIETQVLDMLQPYQKLEKLTIMGYGGTIFPSWLGNTSFSSLVLLRFEGCRNCTSLPPIGQLHLLKDLFIVGLAAIEGMGPEFYGNGGTTPFQSLENLCIKDMQEWKDWIHLGFGKDIVRFPCLRKLSIEDCPKLIGYLPEHLPSLESLCITRCEQLQMFVPSLPEHCNIEISKCKEVSWSTVPGSLLNSVVLSDISGCVFLAERFLQGSSKVARTGIVNYEKTISFKQFGDHSWEGINLFSDFLFRKNFSPLKSFMTKEREELEQGLACRLQYLALRDCECLMKLPQLLHSLSFLKGLSLEDCPQLVSIPEVALPSELRFITIKNCEALESLPKSWVQSSNTSLEGLSIEDCDSLTYIARAQLPPNLKMLKIENCHSLQTLVEKEEVSITHEENVNRGSCWNNFSLEYLYINGCSKLDSIAESFHGGISLERIEIYNCLNLKLLPNDLHNLNHLQDFCISGCGILVPEWLLPSVNLKTLRIAYCDQLDTLPSGLNNLTSLQSLSIMGCPGIVSFPENGFPTNLISLSIIDVKFCKALFEWGLHRLTSLKQLSIWGGCPDVMPFLQEEIGMILPTSLTILHIDHFTNLESLSSIFRNLISLEELHLGDCPKLKFFPKKGLPPSLVRLQIWRCPLLKQSCEKDGLYWPMISLIPCVHIDFKKVTPADERALILYKATVASG